MIKKILLSGMIIITILIFLIMWIRVEKGGLYMSGWLVFLASIITCFLLILISDLLLWHHLKQYIETRLESIDELFERHIRGCPVLKEQLLNSCTQYTEDSNKNEVFRRSYLAQNPKLIIQLRELAPSVTPTEELLCMYINMGLNNKEIADRLSISQGSLHTVRYRLKRKLPLQVGEQMDEWIRKLNTEPDKMKS